MTNDALKKQGMTVEKRETPDAAERQGACCWSRARRPMPGRIRKWLLIAPIGDLTAMVSFEMPDKRRGAIRTPAIRAALASLADAPARCRPTSSSRWCRSRSSELAGLRLVRVVPGVAVQFTDGPKDTLDASEQAASGDFGRGRRPAAAAATAISSHAPRSAACRR